MFKRIIKETRLSMKRNPVKIVVSALIILISTTIIFSGVLLHREVNTALKNMDEYSKRHASFEYIDTSLVSEKRLELGEGKPVLENSDWSDLNNILNAHTTYRPLFDSFARVGDESFYSTYNYNVEDLGIYPHGFTQELMHDDEYVYFTYSQIDNPETQEKTDDSIILKEGEFPKDGNFGITISEKFAQRKHLKVGDEIEISSLSKKRMYDIIGIYETTREDIKDYVIFANDSIYGRIVEDDIHFSPIVHIGIVMEFAFVSLEDAEISVPMANKLLSQNPYTENIHLVNKLDENKAFMNYLKFMKLGIYIVVLLTIILSVYLLKNIMRKDIKQYQEDRFNSVFEEDRELVRKSNCLQMMIIVILSIVISIFSSPAINEIILKPIVVERVEKINKPYHLTADEIAEDQGEGYGDAMLVYYEQYDLYTLVKMDFGPDVLYTTVTVVLVGVLGTVAVILGNRPPKKENE